MDISEIIRYYYIDGDKYFKTARESHNLDRARTQFKLIEDMEKVLPEMEKIVEDADKRRSTRF